MSPTRRHSIESAFSIPTNRFYYGLLHNVSSASQSFPSGSVSNVFSASELTSIVASSKLIPSTTHSPACYADCCQSSVEKSRLTSSKKCQSTHGKITRISYKIFKDIFKSCRRCCCCCSCCIGCVGGSCCCSSGCCSSGGCGSKWITSTMS